MSIDERTLVERKPKTILVIFRESRSWLTRWYTWVERSDPERQIVKDIVIDQHEVDQRRRSLPSSQTPVQKAFQFVVNAYTSGDILCIFGFGESGGSSSFQLAHMLHTNLAADLCSFSDSKAVTGSMEESSVVQCVAVAYNRKLETPLGLLNGTIARLPNSVERVICINEEDQDIFACLANRKRDGRVYPSEIWRFDYAPPWRVTRHWLIDQTADSIRYLPEYVKKWFGTSPKTMSILEPPSSKGDVSETKRATVTFRAHRIHDDHIINILEDDEFDLRYQVWTM